MTGNALTLDVLMEAMERLRGQPVPPPAPLIMHPSQGWNFILSCRWDERTCHGTTPWGSWVAAFLRMGGSEERAQHYVALMKAGRRRRVARRHRRIRKLKTGIRP